MVIVSHLIEINVKERIIKVLITNFKFMIHGTRLVFIIIIINSLVFLGRGEYAFKLKIDLAC